VEYDPRPMDLVLLFLAPFVLLGVGVLFVAFSGGPGRAREVYLTRGGRGFRAALVFLYVAVGIAVPALVIVGREESVGSSGSLATADLDPDLEQGKETFLETCSSCHTLEAANARGVTGPDLDELAPLDEERVLNAIETGGTGEGRMPAMLLEGEDAQLVAAYVARVAGR
jgi:mono/diheme cytochrome c family protein